MKKIFIIYLMFAVSIAGFSANKSSFILYAGANSVEKEIGLHYICTGETLEFIVADSNSVDSVVWHFNDHMSGDLNTSNEFSASHTFNFAGTYTIELISFVNGVYQITTGFVEVIEEPLPLVLYDSMNCFGEEVQLWYYDTTLTGLSYLWNTPTGNITGSDSTGAISIHWNTPGIHTVYFEVSRFGCVSDSLVQVLMPEPMIAAYSSSDAVCYNGSDGSASISVTGGTGNYAYSWPDNSDESMHNNLSSGTYFVSISDEHLCTQDLTIQINQPDEPIQVYASYTGACKTGEVGNILLSVSGGVLDYSFLWNFNNCTSKDLTGILPGDYQLTVTDQNACIYNTAFSLTLPEIPLNVGFNVNNVSCYGKEDGSIMLNVSGGAGDYSYLWDDAAETASTVSGLAPGEYSISVTDSRLCTFQKSLQISQPAEILLNVIESVNICYGNKADLYANVINDTVGLYNFLWSTADTGSTIVVNPDDTTLYGVVAINADGCTSDTAEITVNVSPPISSSFTLSSNSVCKGEEVLLNYEVSGGDGGPYSTTLADGNVFVSPASYTLLKNEQLIIISNDACGSATLKDTIQLRIYEPYQYEIIADQTTGCAPFTISLQETGSGNVASFDWYIGKGDAYKSYSVKDPVCTIASAGIYDVKLTVVDNYGCSNTVQKVNMIQVYETPEAIITVDKTEASVLEPDFEFISSSENAYIHNWEFGDDSYASIAEVIHTYESAGEYNVFMVAESEFGCVDTAYLTVEVTDEVTFYVPTAFTPNNDGENDDFIVFTNGINNSTFFLAVYDRWGSKVFESNNPEQYWNGHSLNHNPCKTGVYTWYAYFEDENKLSYEKSGNVTLIR